MTAVKIAFPDLLVQLILSLESRLCLYTLYFLRNLGGSANVSGMPAIFHGTGD